MAECKHAVIDWGSNYLGHSAYAERKMALKEKQRRCPICKRYVWTSEWDGAAHLDGSDVAP